MTRSSKSHTHNAWRSLGYFFIITAGVGLAANAASEEGLAGSSISTTTSSSTDRDLRTRLEGIFREIDGLQRVEVSVSKGVVVLSGEALNDTAVERALQISKRVQGVVSVTDSVSRSFELDSSIQELFNGFENQLLELYRGLPLYALAIVVFCALAWTGKVAANWSSLWNRLSPTPFLAALMAQSVRALTIVIALVVVLDLLGASTLLGTLLGGAGVLSLAIGFAIRDTIENYIASVLMSVRQPFRPNDHVVIGEHEGFVLRLNARATVLMTLEGNHLRIPNATVFKSTILNYSSNPERRLSFALGVDGADDASEAAAAGLKAIEGQSFVLSDPKPFANVASVNDSNITIEYFAWINQDQTDLLKARSSLITTAKNHLERKGFTIPEPIYRIRFDQPHFSSLGSEETHSMPDNATGSDRTTPRVAKVLSKQSAPDVSPDRDVRAKVRQERDEHSQEDLLTEHGPVE